MNERCAYKSCAQRVNVERTVLVGGQPVLLLLCASHARRLTQDVVQWA